MKQSTAQLLVALFVLLTFVVPLSQGQTWPLDNLRDGVGDLFGVQR